MICAAVEFCASSNCKLAFDILNTVLARIKYGCRCRLFKHKLITTVVILEGELEMLNC